MPHRILILTNRIPYPLHDGGALAMDAMIRGYAREGWAVHLLAMNTSRHRVDEKALAGLYSDIAGFCTVEVDNEVSRFNVLKNLFFSRDPEHAERFQSAAFSQKLAVLLSDIKPDVVQLESPFLATYLPLIRNGSKAVVVYRMHNVEGQIWARLATESSGLKQRYLKILANRIARYERQLWESADLLLPITQADADAARSAGIKTQQVVAPFAPSGLNMQVITHEHPTNDKLKVYHIGAMDWLPNAEGVRWFLDDVWPKLHGWASEVTFHLAGRAMPESFKTGLPEGVFCAGEVGDARAFIADKDVLVVPIRSGGGIRVKILEAMAAGKLVISTDVGMQGIEAQPELHYLSANSADEFAQLIAWASAHSEKVESITSFAQKLIAEQYDAAAIMSHIIQKLESMMAG